MAQGRINRKEPDFIPSTYTTFWQGREREWGQWEIKVVKGSLDKIKKQVGQREQNTELASSQKAHHQTLKWSSFLFILNNQHTVSRVRNQVWGLLSCAGHGLCFLKLWGSLHLSFILMYISRSAYPLHFFFFWKNFKHSFHPYWYFSERESVAFMVWGDWKKVTVPRGDTIWTEKALPYRVFVSG